MKRFRHGELLILFCISFLHLFSVPPIINSVAVQDQQPGLAAESRHLGQQAEADSFKLTVNVDLVTTEVTVIGKPVSNLRPEDFTVLDNGATQQITYFSRDQIPLAVALLIDTSLSVQRFLPFLQIAGGSALRRLKPDDQVVLFSFNRTPERITDLTRDRILIAKKISKLDFRFGTDIYYAIHEAAKYLREKAPHRRRAIIMVSDNCHVGFTNHNPERAKAKTLEAAATLYSIRTPGEGQQEAFCFDSNLKVKQIAEDTGGELIDIRSWASLQEALERAVVNLRMQYTLGFNPSSTKDKGRFHKLEVRLTDRDRCPECRLLSRAGYYEGMAPPWSPAESPSPAPGPAQANEDQMLIQQSILTAGTTNVEIADLAFSISATPQTYGSRPKHFKVDLKIDPKRIKFRPDGDKRACRLHITIFLIDDKGKILGSEWKILEGALREETYKQALSLGIPFSTTIPAKTQRLMIKVVIYDEYSDRVGSRSYWLY